MTTSITRRNLYLGYLASLGSAACYGSVALVGAKIVRDYAPPIVGSAFSLLFGTMIVAVLFHRHIIEDYKQIPRRGWIFISLAGLASTWGVSFWFLALSNAPVVLVTPVAATNPLMALLITHVFLQQLERVTLRTVFGALMVVGGVALIAIGNG